MRKAIIHPDADIRPLAVATIEKAVMDLKSKDVKTALDAAFWLIEGDLDMFASVCNVEIDGAAWLASGKAKGTIPRLFVGMDNHTLSVYVRMIPPVLRRLRAWLELRKIVNLN